MDKKEITWILSVCSFLLTRNENTSGKKGRNLAKGPRMASRSDFICPEKQKGIVAETNKLENGMNGPQSSNHIPEAENSDR